MRMGGWQASGCISCHDNHNGLTTLNIGVCISLKVFTSGLALIIVFKEPKWCCQLPNLLPIPHFLYVKMRSWELDGGICDSNA